MNDKTPLEIDIEREQSKKSQRASLLVIFLIIIIVVLGIYTLKLRTKLSLKERAIATNEQNYIQEKNRLLNIIEDLKEGKQQ
jgi:hypothetical protein